MMKIIPGSLEAIEKGCICEVEIDQATEEESYLINENCPVHGHVIKQHKKNIINAAIMGMHKMITDLEKHLLIMNILWVIITVCMLYKMSKQ